jgi:hypothetical protein
MRGVSYQEAIGSLMYAALGTRPNIAFAVTHLSQFMQNPGRPHWEAVKRVLHYLKGTIDHQLVIGNRGYFTWASPDLQGCNGLEGFADADGSTQEHRCAISGYVFTIDGTAVSWSSKKQPIVTLSTTKAEYVAATHAAKEALWIRMFISEIARPLTRPVTLYCDNQSAIAVSKNDRYHSRTKHIDICYHFIRDIAQRDLISVHYCPTSDMTANMLTKRLATPALAHLAGLVGLGRA